MHGVAVGVGQAPQVGVGVTHGAQVGVGVAQGQQPVGQLTVGEGDGVVVALPLSILQRQPGRKSVLAAAIKKIHTTKFFLILFIPLILCYPV